MRSVEWYQAELDAVGKERDDLRALDRTLNILRAVLFFGGVLLLGLGFAADEGAPLGARLLWWAGWGALLSFFIVVTIHESQRARIEALRNRRSVLRRLMARLERRWDRLPVWALPSFLAQSVSEDKTGQSRAVEAGSVADDLDLFGSGSLMQLVSMAYTGPGLRKLGIWLTEAAIGQQAEARSLAARSLVADRSSRVRFYELARAASGSAAEPDAFAEWASGKRWLDNKGWLNAWAWMAPVLSVILFFAGLLFWPAVQADSLNAGLDVASGMDAAGEVAKLAGSGLNLAGGVVLASFPMVVNLLLTVWMSGPVHSIFAKAVSRRGDIEGYSEMFACGEALPSEPELVARIRGRLVSDEGSAAEGMKKLSRLSSLVAGRRGGLGYVIFMILQLLCLWDVHLLGRLEAWQRKFGKFADDWFDALGELEALESLAALYDDYPDWAVPRWIEVDKRAIVKGRGLAHPLLRDDVRVYNDVEIGPQGSLLLVTGSNMSGKSTMLRSVGLNVVLAGAGGPVCASEFTLPSIELATSIRVRDSVKEGVSFYMAELHRLRDVVNHAKRLGPDGDRIVLYLLDEILQGTNSRERSVAVVSVLRHLLDSGAIGAISTHDLELAEDPDLESVAHVVHFRETIEMAEDGKETMRFDYRMREGVTPTTNALRLLEMVGLGGEK